MANVEHLKLLQEGTEVWNAWKIDHPHIRPNLNGANLSRKDLEGSNLQYVDLIKANLSWANLTEVNLKGANLSNANLSEAILSRANLRHADLTGSILNRAHLSEADLSEAILTGADLSRAKLSRANLRGADLRYTEINETYLDETDFFKAKVGWTHFAAVDLRATKGLEAVRHAGPSTIGIDTLYQSEGLISVEFLRQAGIPGDFLKYLPDLMNTASEYYTCFISFASKDQAFAEKLYVELQTKGVRCWFAPEDLKIGDKYQDRIFQTIRLYDKLLLILSEASVNSKWVEAEAEAALKKEVQKKCMVLFPVRLDNTVMQSTSGWADSIRQTRHIGDFTHWKDHNAYQQAFQRLLRDLQSKRPQPHRKRESR